MKVNILKFPIFFIFIIYSKLQINKNYYANRFFFYRVNSFLRNDSNLALQAIKKFLKAIEIVGDECFINQTYIKLGICYKEFKQFDLAIENLKKGKSLTSKSIEVAETKQK